MAEAKTTVKTTEKSVAVKKPVVEKKEVSATKVKEVKPEVKAEVKAEVKPEVKKTASKKTTAKKTESTTKTKVESEIIHLQFAGKTYQQKDLVKIAKDVWVYDLGKKASDFKTVELYVKPEESIAYYVINQTEAGSFEI